MEDFTKFKTADTKQTNYGCTSVDHSSIINHLDQNDKLKELDKWMRHDIHDNSHCTNYQSKSYTL